MKPHVPRLALCLLLLTILPRVESIAGPTAPLPPRMLAPARTEAIPADVILKAANAPGGLAMLARVRVVDDPKHVGGHYVQLQLVRQEGVPTKERVVDQWSVDGSSRPSLTGITQSHDKFLVVAAVAADGLTELSLFRLDPEFTGLYNIYGWSGRDGGAWICPHQWQGDVVLMVRQAMHKSDNPAFRWDRESLLLMRLGRGATFCYPLGTIGDLYPTDATGATMHEINVAARTCDALRAIQSPRPPFTDWYPLDYGSDTSKKEVIPQTLGPNPVVWREE